MSKTITISRPAYLFADADDSLAAAAAAVAAERRIDPWEVTASWEDDERELILLDVPPLKLIGDEVYDIDAMPMFGGRPRA